MRHQEGLCDAERHPADLRTGLETSRDFQERGLRCSTQHSSGEGSLLLWQCPGTSVVVTVGQGAAGISIKWVEALDAGKLFAVPRTAPTAEKDPAPNVNSVRLRILLCGMRAWVSDDSSTALVGAASPLCSTAALVSFLSL